VILKATQGQSYVDPTFYERVVKATQAGLLIGAYHFCDGTWEAGQADHFLDIAGDIPGVRLFLDVEDNPASAADVTVKLASEIALEIEKLTGLVPDTYTARYQPDGTGKQWPAEGDPVLKRGALWFAAYGESAGDFPWAGWPSWSLWQYTDKGKVPGIYGPVDLNRFDGTAEELRSWWLGKV
jgi:lysozyme